MRGVETNGKATVGEGCDETEGSADSSTQELTKLIRSHKAVIKI